ncbi:MAG: ATP-dependent Clp protease proteolytic subunit [Thermoanaerobaculia bacterium]
MAADPAIRSALLDAKRAKIEAEGREALAQAELTELSLERERDKREHELAANERHRVYVFDTDTSEGAVKKCISQLTTWARQEAGCPIEVQINSPGGSIFAGFALIDFIRDLRDRGHRITMVGLGMVASMAGVLLQAADERVMGQNAFLLIHEGSLGAIGDFGDVEDRVELMGLMHERILTLFEDRAKPINPKTTKTFIRNRWKRKDWWITAAAARNLGFVDEVR